MGPDFWDTPRGMQESAYNEYKRQEELETKESYED